MGPLWDEAMEIYLWDWSHITKMAAMPLYGKTLWKSSFQEQNVRWPWNLVCSIENSDDHDLFYVKVSFDNLDLSMWKKQNHGFSYSIIAGGIKIDIPSKFTQIVTVGWHSPILSQGRIWSLWQF